MGPPSPFFGPMCTVCWGVLYNVVPFLPFLRDRKAAKPESVNVSDWKVWREFFSKHRNRLFWKGNSNKPRYRLNQQSEFEERTISYLEYTSDGTLINPYS